MRSTPVSNDNGLSEFIQQIPKVELHAHLNGCIREATLFDLARLRNVKLPEHHFAPTAVNFEEQDHCMYNVLPRSLQDCFDMFAEIPACVNDLVALRRITYEALEDFAAHGVAFLELRSTPKILLKSASDPAHKTATKSEYVETILSVMREYQREERIRFQNAMYQFPRLPLVCRFLVSVDRSQSLEEARENIQLAIDFSKESDPLVVGVDLGGNPTKQNFQLFEPVFAEARAAGLKITLHCAEVPCGNDNPEKDTVKEKLAREEAAAMINFRPDRIGHALLLPPSLRLQLANSNIPIETCPTSNVMTLELAKKADGNLIHGLQQHPSLRHWLASDQPLAVGTDDPGVFDTTATQELLLLYKAFDLDKERIGKLVSQSMDFAFCDNETKNSLTTMLQKRINVLLA